MTDFPTPESLELDTPDIATDRLEALRDLIPEAFSEGKVDFDKLRAALGDVVDGRPERYSFTWAGKRDAIRLLQTPSAATLVPAPEESVNWETMQHLFIEGDNLEVLKLLYKAYFGKVKLIYIDPPYNTGNDFVYPDDFADPLGRYLEITGQKDAAGNLLTSNPETSGRYHSAWLNMMYPRLFMARQLLREDGIIFVSIDDNEHYNLRVLMDEIFGGENYLATFSVQVRYPDKTLVEDADYHKLVEVVLAYRKSDFGSLNKQGEEYSIDKFVWRVAEINSPKVQTMGGKRVEIFQVGDYEIQRDKPSSRGLKEIWATGKILDGNSSGRFFRDHLADRWRDDGLGVLYKVYGIGDDQYNYRYFTGPKRLGATKGKYYQGIPKKVLGELETSRREKPIPTLVNCTTNLPS